MNHPALTTTKITTFPLGYNAGDKFRFIIQAFNKSRFAQSLLSLPFFLVSVPDDPNTAPYVVSSLTNAMQITVTYPTVINTGGSPIISYELQMSNHATNNSFITISGGKGNEYLGLTVTTTNNIIKSNTYYFRYRAVNNKGYSNWSPIGAIKAAAKPSPPSHPGYNTSTSTSIAVDIFATLDDGGSPIIRYNTYIDGGDNTPFNSTPACQGLTMTCPIASLTSGKVYRIYVTSENSYGESIPSTYLVSYAADVLPQPTKPSQNVALSSSNSIVLTWSPAVATQIPITGYSISIFGDKYNSYTMIYNGINNSNTFTTIITNLINNVPYQVKLTAYNFNGPSIESAAETVYACTNPTNFGTPRVTLQSSTQINILWTQPNNNGGCLITGYAVFRDDGLGGNIDTEANSTNDSVVRNNPSLNSLAITYFPATPIGKTFRIRVVAYNLIGSVTSSSVSAILADAPSAPVDTVTLNTLNVNSSSMTVEYSTTDPSNGGSSLISYELQMDEDNRGDFKSLIGYNDNYLIKTFTINNISLGRTYVFRYRAKNLIGWGPFSPLSTIIPSDVPLSPPMPTFNQYTASDELIINIRYTTSDQGSPVIGYELWSDDGNLSSTLTQVMSYTGIQSTFTLTQAMGYTIGKIYRFQTRAINANGMSNFSAVAYIGFGGVPAKPSSVNLVAVSSLLISWNAPASNLGIIGFNVQMDDGLGGNKSTIYTGTNLQYKVDNLIKGFKYTFIVNAININGESIYSDPISYYYCYAPSIFNSLKFISADSITKTITISWYPPEELGGCGLLGYNVYRNDGPNTNIDTEITTGIDNNDANLSTFTIPLTSKALGDIFNIQVKARNVNGYVSSNVVSVALSSLPNKPVFATLVKTSTNKNQLMLNLENVNGNGSPISSYEIQYRNLNHSTSAITIYSSSNSVLLNYNIKPYTTYGIVYRAKNYNGWGPYSDEAYLSASTLPGTPLGIEYKSSDNTEILVKINPSRDDGGILIKYYEIYYDTIQASDNYQSYAKYSISSDDLNNIQLSTNLAIGTMYRFKVLAINDNGNSQFSKESYMCKGSLPNKPAQLSKDKLLSTKTSILLIWDDQPVIDNQPTLGYMIKMDDGSGTFNTIYDGSNNPTTKIFTASNLQSGNAYRFILFVRNCNGYSDPSDAVEYYSCMSPAVKPPIVTQTTKADITISWTDAEDNGCNVSYYQILIDDGLEQGGNISNNIDSTYLKDHPELRTYTISTLSNTGNAYRIKLQAVNVNGNGYSTSVSTVLAKIPDTPTISPYSDDTVTDNTKIKILVTPYTTTNNGGIPILSYEIQMDDGIGGDFISLSGNPIHSLDNSKLIVTNITAGINYRFRYRALNAKGWSDWSPTSYIKAATSPSRPSKPYLISASASDIVLGIPMDSNNNGDLITTYILERNGGSGDSNFNPVSTYMNTQTATLTVTDDAIVSGSIYKFRVRASNAKGNSDYSDISSYGIGVSPSKPNNLTKNDSKSDRTKISVNWTPIATTPPELPVTGYIIQMSEYPFDNYTIIYETDFIPTLNEYTASNLKTSIPYSFKIAAKYVNGLSEYSDPEIFIPCDTPSGLSQPYLIYSTKTEFKIRWNAPLDDGGCPVISYYLYASLGDSAIITQEVDAAIINNKPELREYVYDLSAGTNTSKTFSFYLKVKNTLYSTQSQVVTFILASVPEKPSLAPTFDLTYNSANSINIVYPVIPDIDNGGSTVLSYELQYFDIIKNSWLTLIGPSNKPSLLNEYIYNTNVIKGNIYRFRYRAININGPGEYSNIGYIPAVNKPSIPPKPTIESVTDSDITINIYASEDNGGFSIIRCDIYFADYTYDTWTASIVYNGMDSKVKLTTSNTSIVSSSIYKFRTNCKNIYNLTSDFSSLLYAKLINSPTTPNIPYIDYSLSSQSVDRTKTSLMIKWNAVLDTEPILGYNVYMTDVSTNQKSMIYNNLNQSIQLYYSKQDLVTGNQYIFSVQAVNYNGPGEESNILTAYACITPIGLATPTYVNISKTIVEINWFPIDNDGGCSISNYYIKHDSATGTDINTLLDSTYFNNNPLILQYTWTLNVSEAGKLYRIQLYAGNKNGLTAVSNILPIVIGYIPDKPSSPPLIINTKTTNSDIGVSFSASFISDDGGFPILSLELQVDDGNGGNFTSVIGYTYNSIIDTYTISQNIVQGSTYRLQYRARNKLGWGAFSDMGYILAASSPAQPDTPVYISSTTDEIVIDYKPVLNNGGSVITGYKVYLASINSNSYSELVTNNANIFTYTISRTTASLTLGGSYRVAITAVNSIDESIRSNDVVVGMGPLPNTPSIPIYQSLLSDLSNIYITWNAVATTDLPILGYILYMDNGIGGTMDIIYDGSQNATNLSYKATNLTSGRNYKFKLQAVNINGKSDFSAELDVILCFSPILPFQPTLSSISSTSITVSWLNTINNNGCPIKTFKLYRDDGDNTDPSILIDDANIKDKPLLTSYTVNITDNTLISKTISFKLQATNAIGTGSSMISKTVLADVPTKPSPAPSKAAGSSSDVLNISYDNISSNGGSTILNYDLQMDDGLNGSFKSITISPQKYISITNNIIKGYTYRFRYRAYNIIGWSIWSDVSYIQAAGNPSQPLAPSYVYSDSTSITVNIHFSSENNGSALKFCNLYIDSGNNLNSSYTAVSRYTGFITSFTLTTTDDGLGSPGTIYRIISTCDNDAGTSEHSDPLIVGLGVIPDKPVSVHIDYTKSDKNSLWIEWDYTATQILPIKGYRVYMDDGNNNGVYSLICDYSTNSIARSCLAKQLQTSKNYQVKVMAININGEGPFSDVLSVTVCSKPSAPVNFTTTSITNTVIKFAWNTPINNGGCNILGYKLLRNSGDSMMPSIEESAGALNTSPNLSSLSLTFSSGIPGKIYLFTLAAINKIDTGKSTDLLELTFASMPATPTLAPILDSSSTSNLALINMPLVSTDGDSPITSYNLQINYSDGKGFTDLTGNLSNNLNLSVKMPVDGVKIKLGNTYQFRYRVKNSIGWSEYSPVAFIRIGGKPGVPSSLVYDSSTATSIQMKITPLTDLQGFETVTYEIYRDNGDYTDLNIPTSYDGVSLLYNANGLTTGKLYRFAIRSITDGGISEFSNISTFGSGILPTTPSAPMQDSTNSNSGQIGIKWDKQADNDLPVLGYILKMSTGNSVDYQIIYDGSNNRELTNFILKESQLKIGQKYNFVLYSINANGLSPSTTVTTVYFCNSPSDFSKASCSSTYPSIIIKWSMPENDGGCPIKEYVVYRDDGASGLITTEVNTTNDPAIRGSPYRSQATITNFPATSDGKLFRFIVNVYNAGGYKLNSNIVSCYLANVPNKPANAPTSDDTVTNASTLKILFDSLSTSDNGGKTILSYELQVDDGLGGLFKTVLGSIDKPSLITSYILKSNIKKGIVYRVRYRAINAVGNSDWSPIGYLLVASVPYSPIAPGLVSVTNSSIEAKLYISTDDGGSPITNCEIWMDDGILGSNNYTKLVSYTTILDTYNITGLASGKYFGIKYLCKNIKGSSVLSPPLTIATAALPSAPATVYRNNIKSSANSISVYWTTVSANEIPIIGYKIKIIDEDSTLIGLYDTNMINMTGFNEILILNLITGKKYIIFVSSYNFNGSSDDSTPLITYTCINPSTLKAPILSSRTMTDLTLSWNPPDYNGYCTISKYTIYYNDGVSNLLFQSQIITTLDNLEKTITFTNAEIGKSIQFQLEAENAVGKVTSQITAYIVGITPSKPSNPITKDTQTNDKQIVINISTFSDTTVTNGLNIISYEIQIDDGKNNNNFSSIIGTPPMNSMLMNLKINKNIIKGVSYGLRYRVYNIIGYSPWSDIKIITAATSPSTPIKPSLFYVDNTEIQVSLFYSSDNGGLPQVTYELYVVDGNQVSSKVSDYDLSNNSQTFTISASANLLTVGNTYSIKYLAYNDIGASDYSEGLQVALARSATSPTSIALIKPTKTSLKIQWSGASSLEIPITGFKIYIDDGNNSEYSMIKETYDNYNEMYTIDQLTTGLLYKVKITTKNFNGESDGFVKYLNVCFIPSKFTSFRIVSSSSASVLLSWSPPLDNGGCDVIKYEIQKYNSVTYLYELIIGNLSAATFSNTLNYIGTDLGNTYKYRMKVYNVNGASYSNEVSVLISDVPPTPSNGPDKITTLSSINSITVNMPIVTIPAGHAIITSYELQMDDGKGGSFVTLIGGKDDIINNKPNLNNDYTVSNLTLFTPYKFRYRVYNTIGASQFSPEVIYYTGTLPGITDKPQLVSSTDTTIDLLLYIPIDNGGSAITDYELHYSDCVGSYTQINDYIYTTYLLSYQVKKSVITTLVTGDLYCFITRAKNINGLGEFSNPLMVGLGDLPSAPVAPSKVLSKSTSSTIYLIWNEITGTTLPIKSYNLKMYNEEDTEFDVIYSGLNKSYIVTNLTPGKSYRFILTATNINGEGDESSEFLATSCVAPIGVSAPALVSSDSSSIKLKWIYPNNNGGCPITSYSLLRSDGTTQDINISVDPTNVENKPNLYEYTASLDTSLRGKTILFKLTATNSVGSTISVNYLPAILAGVPSIPSTPTEVTLLTTSKSLTVSMPSISTPNDGYSNIISYNLQIDDGNNGDFREVSNSMNTTVTITDNIKKGSVYKLRYRVRNAIGYSPYSNTLSILAADIPSQPDAPILTSITKDLISLQFNQQVDNGGSSISSYELYISKDIGVTYNILGNYSTSASTFDVSKTTENLTYGNTYIFKYAARNGKGLSPLSKGLTIGLSDDPTTPNKPDIISSNKTSITININAVADNNIPIIAYELYMDNNDSNFKLVSYTLSPLETIYVINNLPSSMIYNFKVRAKNYNNYSSFSPITTGYTCSVPTGIKRPGMTVDSNTSIKLTWTPPENDGGCFIKGYRLWSNTGIGTDINNNVDDSLKGQPYTFSYLITGLNNAETYSYKLEVINQAGSSYSNIVSFVISNVPDQPDKPIRDNTNTDTQRIGVTFTLPDGNGSAITGLEIQIDDGNNGDYTSVENSYQGLSYIFNNLQKGKYYNVRYRVINNSGMSLWSDPLYTQAAVKPSQPNAPQLDSATDTTITLKFSQLVDNGGSAVTSYTLYMNDGTTNGLFTKITNYSDNSSLYTVNAADGVTQGNIYKFKYVASNVYGDSSESSEITYGACNPLTKPNAPYKNNQFSSTNSIALSWNTLSPTEIPCGAITGYIINMLNDNGVYEIIYNGINSPNLRNTVIPNLLTGNKYTFTLNALYTNGKSPASDPISFYSCIKPSNDINLTIIKQTTTSQTLKWNIPSNTGGCGIKSFALYRDDGNGNSITYEIDSVHIRNNPILTSYKNTDFPATSIGKNFNYKLLIINNSGEDTYSNITSGVLAGVPADPTQIIVADSNNTGANQITITVPSITDNLTNNNGSSIVTYNVQMDDSYGNYKTLYGLSPYSLISTYTIYDNLTPGAIYKFRYRIGNSIGFSDWSSISYIQAIEKPNKPQPLIYNSSSPTMIKLTIPTIISDGYAGGSSTIQIYRDDGTSVYPPVFTQVYDNIYISTYTFDQTTDITLVTGAIYRFKYTITNSSNLVSQDSDYLSAAMEDLPSKVLGLTKEQINSSNTSTTIKWNTLTDSILPGGMILSYKVYKINEFGDKKLVYTTNTPMITSYTANNLISNKNYSFYVSAVNYNGEGILSDVLTVWTCGIPKNLTSPIFISSTTTTMKLKIIPPTDNGGCGIIGYILYRNDGVSTNVNIEVNSANDSNLRNNPNLSEVNVTNLQSTGLGKIFKFQLIINTEAGFTNYPTFSYLFATAPSAPSSGPLKDNINSSISQIAVTLPTISNNGSPITSYELQIADSLTGSFTTSLEGLTNIHIVNTINNQSLIKGNNYIFRYRAKNTYGISDWSPETIYDASTKPSKPASPVVTQITSTSITLSFNFNSIDNNGKSVTSYNLYIEDGNSGLNLVSNYNNIDNPYQLTLANDGIVYGHVYKFALSGVNSNGESTLSDAIATGFILPPSKVMNVIKNSQFSTNNSIAIQWDLLTQANLPAGEILGYGIYIDNGNGGSMNLVYDNGNGLSNPSNNFYILNGLIAGMKYNIHIAARNINGYGTPSDTVEINTCLKPNKPTNFIISKSQTSPSIEVVLTWSPPSSNGGCAITGYKLFRDDGNGGTITTEVNSTDEPMLTNNPAATSFTITNYPAATIGSIFRYQLIVYNLYENTVSNILSAILASSPDKPPSIPTFNISDISDKKIKFSISSLDTTNNGGSLITSYDIQIDDGNNGQYNTIYTNTLQTTFTIFTNISKGKTYRVRYRGNNIYGSGPYSEPVYILAATTPSIPPKLTFVSATSIKINIIINPSSNNGGSAIDKYVIYRNNGINDNTLVEVTYNGVSTTLEIDAATDSMTTGLIYSLQVIAHNAYGYSDYSDSILVALVSPPGTPGKPTLVSASKTGITIKWNKVNDTELPGGKVNEYKIYYTDNILGDYTEVKVQNNNANILTYTLANTTIGKSYTFKISALNYNGEGSQSDSETFKSCSAPANFNTPYISIIVASTLSPSVIINWNTPQDDGGCPITGYAVYRDDGSGSNYIEVNTTNDIAVRNIPNLNSLEITNFPVNPLGMRYSFKIQAFNYNGSIYSPSISSLLSTVPMKPSSNPALNISDSSDTNLSITLPPLTTLEQIGGSPILSYHLQMDDGHNGLFSDVVGGTYDNQILNINITTGITKGLTYRLRYRCKNIVGHGQWSDILYSSAYTKPSTPDKPTIISTSDTEIQLQLYSSLDNGGSNILEYEVEINDGDLNTQFILLPSYVTTSFVFDPIISKV